MGLVGFGVLFAGRGELRARERNGRPAALVHPAGGAARGRPRRSRTGWRAGGWRPARRSLAVALLWPLPARDPLRGALVAACRALGGRLRADAAFVIGRSDGPAPSGRRPPRGCRRRSRRCRKRFFATPYRPTGLSTAARALVRLVDELGWLNADRRLPSPARDGDRPRGVPGEARRRRACSSAGADLLERPVGLARAARPSAVVALRGALEAVEAGASDRLPARWGSDDSVITALDPGFRAQELGFAASQIAANVELRRRWPSGAAGSDRMLGRQPAGLAGPLAAAQERAVAHVERHSVWLHNSVRGAVGLGLAVFVADVSRRAALVLGRARHPLGAALERAQHGPERACAALAGTAAGFVIGGGAARRLVGTNTPLLWVAAAGRGPGRRHRAGGDLVRRRPGRVHAHAADPVQHHRSPPAGRSGWCGSRTSRSAARSASSSALLFWPRGAGAALGAGDRRRVHRERPLPAPARSAFGAGPLRPAAAAAPAPETEAIARRGRRAARLDDAFRSYLAERGAKLVPLAGGRRAWSPASPAAADRRRRARPVGARRRRRARRA